MHGDHGDPYGAAAVAPGAANASTDPAFYPTVADPQGGAYVGGRPYYAEPYSFRQQPGTLWQQVGAFHPAWANPWAYSDGLATPATVWHVVGTTLPAGGLDPDSGVAQQGISLGAGGHGVDIVGG